MTVDFLGSSISDFLLALESEGRSPATLRTYRSVLAHLARHAGVADPAKLTPAVLRAWMVAMRECGLSVRTQRDYLSTAKTFVGWLSEEGEYGISQQQQQQCRSRVRPPTEEVEPIRPFTDEQIAALEKGCNTKSGWQGMRTLAIISLLLDTGLRASELCGLTLADVDLKLGEIAVRAETSKVRRGRAIALGKWATKEMGRWWTTKRHLWDADPASPWFMGGMRRG